MAHFHSDHRRQQLHHQHQSNQANGSSDMSQVDSFESFSDTNGSVNHQHEMAPDFRSTEAELRSPPEGSSQSDLSVEGYYNQSHRPTSIPSSTEEDRYNLLLPSTLFCYSSNPLHCV